MGYFVFLFVKLPYFTKVFVQAINAALSEMDADCTVTTF